MSLGPVGVSIHTRPALRSRRSAALTRHCDPEQYQLALVDGANPMWISRRGTDSGPASGELVLRDTSRPFEAGARDEYGGSRRLVLHIPRTELPINPDKADRLLARRIPAQRGTGAILVRFLTSLGEHAAECGPEELGRLGAIARDLAAVCLAEQHNLDDPDLAPGTIAERHHISVRSLHLLFQHEEESVSRLIRRRRLERCRADLARPELAHHSVRDLAARWGFANASAFGRAFREAYGLTPRDHRRRSMPGALTDH
ncbi:hypothetical protein VR45_31530 [Streptomyces sp. NRRL S-495]|nr:hypothetical protein VR45_31530 [Streptomyces sp. NRRL S-495]